MIRRILHRRWAASGGVWRSLNRWEDTWINRYHDRHVERYGEMREGVPMWRRPLDRLMSWMTDWQATWRMRP